MSVIKILSENLVNQIAAGEVVERPASVVKELVENSLDAGADRIVVEIKDGGRTLIKITDNGCGMLPEDCELALQRHATSKISEQKDLWNIGTMGFRGEAIASIASVSKMILRSKVASESAGTEIISEGGNLLQKSETGMSDGTQIEVHSLFYNTPARQNYLKAESTEMGHITAVLNKVALANPAAAIKLIHNEKVVFDLPRVTDLLSRVADVFGKATADAMIPVFYEGSALKIDGFVGKPLLSRSSSKHQYFFVNGRPIQHFLLANTIKRAYHSMLMEHKKPVFLLNIKIDPSLIDVNVHPRKLEIRFEDEKKLLSTVYTMVKNALEKIELIPKGFSESQRYMSDSFPKQEGSASVVNEKSAFSFGDSTGGVSGFNGGSRRDAGSGADAASALRARPDFSNKSFGNTQEAMSFTKTFMEERSAQALNDISSIKAISQFANSYIVAQSDEGIVLIDQHAAHERVRFEELMKQYENKEKEVQPLLVPLSLDLTHDEVAVIEGNKDIFVSLGFEIEHFGGKSFVIHAVPSCLAGEDLDEVVRGVIDDILNEKQASHFQGRIEEILTYMSCRSAIKFGQKLALPEMEALLKQMESLERPYTCPHGRPTMVKLTLDELGKMFGRK